MLNGFDSNSIQDLDEALYWLREFQNIFETIEEAQSQATKWLWTYNNDRPNMGIGGITPAMKLNIAA